MFRGIKARIGIATLGILLICVSAIGIMKAFADPNYSIIVVEDDIYDYYDENTVELDGVNGDDFNLSLIIDDYYYITRNIEGRFNASNPYITPSGCARGVSESTCDATTGYFNLEYNGGGPLYNLFTMHYNISPDTPAGVYDLSVNVSDFRAQADTSDPDYEYYIDLSEITPRTDFEITIKRPHDIIFEDSDGNPITEITKYLGDDDFTVNKRTGSGDGDLSDFYISSGYDQDVVSIDSNNFHILRSGMTKVCAYADDDGLYLSSESCFTINIKPILTHSVSVLDETYPETTENNPAVVELDGTENVEINVSLKAKNAFRMLDLEGRFVPYDNYDAEAAPRYIRLNGIWAPYASECELDRNEGFFDCEYESIESDGNWFETNGDIIQTTYNISRDTPAGLYTLPIHINRLEGRTIVNDVDFENGIDFDEGLPTLEVQVLVKRPQRVDFWDENDQPVTEINKTYGDPDFIINKAVQEGDGSINDYYIDSESEDGVVSIIPDSDYIRVLKAGTARICASISETEFYMPSKSCFTINVDPREIWVKKLTIADKQYDGSDSVEIDELLFYTHDSDDLPIYVDLDASAYDVYGLVVDDSNVGDTTANVEIYLNGETSKYYYLAENNYTVPVTINPVPLQNVNATVSSKEYDGISQFPAVTPVIGVSDSGEISLEEDVDFEISYNNGPVYVDGQFVDAGDYQITVSPKAGSNYTFEPFEVTYTITPKTVSISGAEVDDKEYDRTNEASVSMVSFVECSLTKGEDYEAYASLDGSDAGTQDATVYVTLTNQNYSFYYDDLLGRYVYQDTFDVSDVEIFPRTLTNNNTSYDVDGYSNTYTGEEIKPFISLSISFVDGEQPEDPLSLGYDYEIEYPTDTINTGMKYATITGKGNFRGSIGPIEYFISPALVQNLMVATPNQTYTGGYLEPEPVVTAVFNGERITFPASEYDILHQGDFIDAGDYTYTIQESNSSNFHFSTREETFTIEPYEISSSNLSLSQSTFKHNGTSQTPSVTVTVGDTVVNENDYDVEFSADTIGNDESDTTVTVTVTAKENVNIAGSASTTYTITPRDVLTIAGIDDNQQIEYTGSPVALHGNVMVEENPAGIVAEDLTVTWYASDGTTTIDQPTNAGSYKVVYSYEDADYSGALIVNFEITKAASPTPAEMTADFRIESGKTLADIEGERTTGFAWADSSSIIISGNNVYPATYTYNNDTVNYETLTLNVPVYGLAQVDITVSDNEGGTITVSGQNVLEGETVTVTIAPDFGYTLSSITVNGVNRIGEVDANTLTIVAEANNLEIVATFVPIVYEVVEGAEQVYTINEDNEAKFRINASYELFENSGAVYVDNVLVDPKNYISWDGSTYIQFTNEYMNTLAVGTHTLKVVFNDGGTATTTFTIAKSEDELVVPNTGFFTMIDGGTATAISSLAIVLIFLVKKIYRKVAKIV